MSDTVETPLKRKKYTRDEIQKLIKESNLEWKGVNTNTLATFMEILPSASINITDGKIESFGKDSKGNPLPVTQFINSVTRVLKDRGITDYSVEVDQKDLDIALKNFKNVDFSTYVLNDSEDMMTGKDFSDKLIKYMEQNKDSLNANKNFQPNQFSAVIATFVEELPNDIQTVGQKQALIDKMVPFASGAIAKLSSQFRNDAGPNDMVLAANQEQRNIFLQTLRDCMQEANKSQTSDPKALELMGKEYMRGPKSIFKRIKRMLIGDKDSKRGQIYNEYKAAQQKTAKNNKGRG